MFLPAAWPVAFRSRSLRLWSGAVLGVYVLSHLLNVALGLVSVRAMDAAAPVLSAVWGTAPGTLVLVAAFAVHFGLTLRALYRRRTLQMSPREALQMSLGLLLPFMIVSHIVGARIIPSVTGTDMTYAEQVRTLWVTAPMNGGRQAAALLVAWAHGCFGFWFALRGRPWFVRWTWLLYALAILVPVLALIGFAEAGREIVAFSDVAAPVAVPPRGPLQGDIDTAITTGLAVPIILVLLARILRERRGQRGSLRVTYADGRVVTVPQGYSVLEASRVGGVPHVSVCGGRGRCSTCRIRVLDGDDRLPEPSASERATLERSRAGSGVRLACQLRPTRDVTVMPIYAPAASGPGSGAPRLGGSSHERELAVLFCDLRGFTRRAEHLLPFDTVFLLNRYFAIVGEAVEASGGYLDKFVGDGALTLFGLSGAPEEACRRALDALGRIARGLETLNAQFAAELAEPLRIAMGLHVGPAVVGDMGHGQAVSLTAVGDAINVASRLEGEAKERDVTAVISAEVLRRAGRDGAGLEHRLIRVRGRSAPIEAVLVGDALHLSRLGEAVTP